MQTTHNTRPSGALLYSISRATLALWGKIIQLVKYAFSMLWVVDACRKLVSTGGIIAESAFLTATLYVTINATAHTLLRLFLSADFLANLNQLSVIVFSILPELIVVSAIVITFDHWKMFKRTKSVGIFLWAACYTIPTVIFLIMTVQLLISFMGTESATGIAPVATGNALIVRCLAGFSYGIIQMLWDKMGKGETYTKRFDDMQVIILELRQALTRNTSEFEKALSDSAAIHETTMREFATEKITFENTIFGINAQIAQLENALLEAHIAMANKKVLRESDTDSAMHVIVKREKTQPVNIGVKRNLIKTHMKKAVKENGQVNMKHIAKDANVSYAMVRKHKDTLLREITEELTPVEKEG